MRHKSHQLQFEGLIVQKMELDPSIRSCRIVLHIALDFFEMLQCLCVFRQSELILAALLDLTFQKFDAAIEPEVTRARGFRILTHDVLAAHSGLSQNLENAPVRVLMSAIAANHVVVCGDAPSKVAVRIVFRAVVLDFENVNVHTSSVLNDAIVAQAFQNLVVVPIASQQQTLTVVLDH